MRTVITFTLMSAHWRPMRAKIPEGPNLFGGALVSYHFWSATVFFWRARRDSNP